MAHWNLWELGFVSPLNMPNKSFSASVKGCGFKGLSLPIPLCKPEGCDKIPSAKTLANVLNDNPIEIYLINSGPGLSQYTAHYSHWLQRRQGCLQSVE